MALSSIWNTVDGAEIGQSLLEGTRIVRTGIVKGITSAVTTAKMALVDVLAGAPDMPLLGDPFDALYPQYICVLRVARGIQSTNGTMARVWAHYETPGGGGTPLETFAAEDSVTLVAEPTEVAPGTAQQLLCSLTNSSPLYNGTDADIRPIVVNYPRTMRALVLYGLFADQPSLSVLNAANTVNSSTWQGLSAGRWRCEGARVFYSSTNGMYAVSVGFLSRGIGLGEDWSTYAVPNNPSTGERAKVDSADLTILYNQSYQYGIRSDKNAIFKAGFYQTANFGAIFGTSFPVGD